jgi:ABC-type transport system involved in Fe-S cluster assembly fused permease/ATPase subunit
MGLIYVIERRIKFQPVLLTNKQNISLISILLVMMPASCCNQNCKLQWRTKFRQTMNKAENAASSLAIDSLINYEVMDVYLGSW